MAAMEIKLMIDPKSNNVIFAEASKDFVDFLIFLLSLPIGTAIKLLTSESMVGSIGNIHKSVANLDETYLQPNINKNKLLNPFVFSSIKDIPLPLNRSTIISSGKFYTCGKCENCMTNMPFRDSCPDCHIKMGKEIQFSGIPRISDEELNGYVKKEASYMISDDLSVTLISTMSIFSTMEKFNVSKFEERIVKIRSNEALELLKASFQSTTVLTDVFLSKKMEEGQGSVQENIRIIVQATIEGMYGKGTRDMIIRINLVVDPFETVSNVMAKVEDKLGYGENVDLMFEGRYLEETRTLDYYNIRNESVLYTT